METLLISSPFYPLPPFPEKCKFVKENNIIVRDILHCYPQRKGEMENGPYLEGYMNDGQLDYLFYFEEITEIIQKYNSAYFLFRVRYNYHDLLVGYCKAEGESCREIKSNIYLLSAKEAHFTSQTIDMTKTTGVYNLQHKIMKSNSINHPEYDSLLREWLEKLKTTKNEIDKFIDKSKKLRQIKEESKESSEYFEERCLGCSFFKKIDCPLWKNLLKLEAKI